MSISQACNNLYNDLYAPLVTHQTITFSRTGLNTSTWSKGTSHTLSYESNISVPDGYTISNILIQSGSAEYITIPCRTSENGEHMVTFYITTSSVSSIRAYIVIQFVKSSCIS